MFKKKSFNNIITSFDNGSDAKYSHNSKFINLNPSFENDSFILINSLFWITSLDLI